MKKTISVILTVLLMVTLLTTMADASEALQLSVSSTTVVAGEQFTLTVKVMDNPGIAGAQGEIRYDSEKLEYVTANGLTDGNWDFSTVSSDGMFQWYDTSAFSGTDWFTITFKAKESAIGTAQVTLSFDGEWDSIISDDSDSEFDSIAVLPGTVTITAPLHEHDWGTGVVTKEATCEEAGIRTFTCSVCGETKPESIPAKNHAWGAVIYTWSSDNSSVTATRTCSNDTTHVETETVNTSYAVTTAATCEADGVGTYSATFTNTAFEAQSKTVVIPATGHAWGEWTVTTPATEEAEGVKTRTCQNDPSHTQSLAIPKLDHVHKLVKTEAAAASCETAGNSVYYTCSGCGKYFSDEAGTAEIAENSWVIPATGHLPGAAVRKNEIAATCTKAGSYDEVVYCDTCKKELSRETKTVDALGHTWGEGIVTTEPSCTEAGVKTYTCTVCDETKTEEVAALGHDWGEWENTKQSTCSEEGIQTRTCKRDSTHTDTQSLAKVGHTTDSGTVTKAPNCTEKGVKTYTCIVCKEVLTTEEIPALDHDWGEWKVTTPATEEAEGEETRTCQRDDTHIETRAIPKLDHVHKLVKTDAVTPDCEKAGNIVYYTCSKCSKLFRDAEGTQEITQEDTIVAALGHDWGEATYTWADDNSSVTATRTCANDTNHVETETVNTSYAVTTAATCDAAGVGTYSATFTNTAFAAQSKTLEIPATGHTLSKVEAVAASCEAAGNSEYYSCSACGKYFSDEAGTTEIAENSWVIPATGHAWGEWSVTAAPTCASEGVQTRTCKHNDAHTETQPVAALGHDWSEWSVTTAPTCTEAGEETRTCKRDGTHTETQPVAALGHDWGEGTVTKEPSCTEKGESVYTCSACKETKTEELAALGHQSDAGTVTKAATCTEPGIKTYTCTVCGEVVRTETLPALAHTWDAGTVTKAATCTDAGVMTNTCTVCGAKRTTEIPARGHSYENGVCKTCGARQLDFTPRIIEGNGGTAHYGSDYPLKSNAPFSTFLTVYVDGVELSPANYTLMEGSTIVTLKASYIQWLDEGWHSIRIASTLGNADGTFSVSRSPKTGDQDLARLALLFTLGGCGIVMAATLVRKKVRSK